MKCADRLGKWSVSPQKFGHLSVSVPSNAFLMSIFTLQMKAIWENRGKITMFYMFHDTGEFYKRAEFLM